ncbi:MAG: hypothetical protein QF578_22590 [Alphaproteobacteria bacterium]|jgi:hypothetical protein|nr:hypothetical protein [Alphaproteobacteria bacterium]MDP6567633.1 hypothetical protein [Alphaproteobacteria bacterium]MDP6812582.1 hypothetical protein [Alphaproteobacteria bacterium]|tara:strand:- start:214 stop:351 length:138 start_codon:yes stop_codon:yes gene_type:complete
MTSFMTPTCRYFSSVTFVAIVLSTVLTGVALVALWGPVRTVMFGV